MKLFNIFLVFVALLSQFPVAAKAGDSDFTPYLEGAEYRISESEYGDLRAYVERAQKILVRTLEASTAFSGTDLRAVLLEGIHSALESSSLRSELLLFKHALVRATEMDKLFMEGNESAENAGLVAKVILIPAIETALKYYQSSDLPRLASNVVPSPNWLEFAADQVPHLLRALDLAPDRDKRTEMAKKAVGWTARALNSSLERRESATADMIVQLGELYNDPRSRHDSYVPRVQEALLLVYKTHRKPLETLTLAPASAGKDLKMRPRGALVRMGSGSVSAFKKIISFPWFNVGRTAAIGHDNHENNTRGDDIWTMSRTTVTTGGGIATGYDGNAAGDTKSGKAAYLGADIMVSGATGDLEYLSVGSLYAGIEGEVQPTGAPVDWNYSLKAKVAPNMFFVLGGFIAMERNVFGKFEENILRGGWAPQFAIRLKNKDYVLIRAYVGSWMYLCRTRDDIRMSCTDPKAPAEGFTNDGGVSTGGSVLLKKKRFSASFDGSWSRDGAGDRLALDASVTLPLGAIVKNDALYLKGQVVDYEGSGAAAGEGFVFYGLTW